MKTISSILLLSALFGCGKAPEIKKRQPLFSSSEKLVSLSDKANRELVSSKFKNRIALVCDFRIDNRPGYDISGFNYSGFTKNLVAGEAPGELKFLMNNGQSFTVGMRVTDFDIVPSAQVEVDGKTIQMKDTAVVELHIKGREIFNSREVIGEKKIVLHEKETINIKDLFNEEYPQDLMCSLQTEISEEFQGDYVELN